MPTISGSGETKNEHQLNKGVWTDNGAPAAAGFSVIGKRVPLKDAYRKVTGEGVYADDMKFPGMLYSRILHAEKAHAKIKRIDTSKAEALPGVRAVVTGNDAANRFGVLPVSQDELSMAREKVIYNGEPVAAVAADTEEIAAEAIWLIDVEYEPLEEFLKPRDSLKDVSPELQIHDKVEKKHPNTNIHKAVDQEFGDVEGAFKQAEAIVSAEFKFDGISHGFTEPHAIVAHWDADDRLQLYTPQQVPHYTHRALAKVLELPMHRIQVIRTMVGGGFGGKSDPFQHEMIASLLSMKTRRPVKLTMDREETFLTGRGRHPTEGKLAMAFDKEGKLTALDSDIIIDGGAYGSFGVVSAYYNGVLSNGPYWMPAFRYHGKRVYSNRIPSGAMRGHGSVNPRFCTETLMDMAAVKLGLDPCELRLRNFLPSNTLTPYHKFRITSNGIREGLAEAMRRSEWKKKWGKLPYGHGIGVGCAWYISGSALPIHWNKLPQSTVHIKIDMDGGVTVHSLAAEIGQGSDTMLAQCVAEVIGCSLERVHVKSTTTDTAPIDLGSYSSRVTFMAGNAARKAAESIRAQLAAAASRLTGQPAQYFDFAGEEVICRSKPDVRVTFMEALHGAQADIGALIASGSYQAPPLGTTFKGSNAGLSPSYSFSAFICELKVDPDTGFVQPLKIWAAHDCGRALNPLAVEGQIEGSVHMGLGQALTEQLRYRGAQLLNGNFLDYKIPTPFDTPEIEAIIVESADPEGPFGAKECGEGALAPIIPAVGNAIYDAVGVRMFEVPMTPDRVLRAIDAKKRAETKGE
ncbi:MAG: molybdopterin-dependent oxidoreductase [Planctomycetes bacterium]|nr:molybdopterin-dependent oxidoreductase [Planctomycetota bacterium]